MGRNRSFDPDDVLEKATILFQHNGYYGTSLSDLTAGLNLSRSSLYSLWPDKSSLYYEALKRYAIRYQQTYADWAARKAESGLASIRNLLIALASLKGFDAENGCFLSNASAELAITDPEVRKICLFNADFCQSCLSDVISRGQLDLSIRTDIKPQILAKMIHQQIVGMRLATTLATPVPDLLQTAEATLLWLAPPSGNH